jgi:hypothetical protein
MNLKIQKTYDIPSGKLAGWMVYDADDTTSAMSAYVGHFETEAEALACIEKEKKRERASVLVVPSSAAAANSPFAQWCSEQGYTVAGRSGQESD